MLTLQDFFKEVQRNLSTGAVALVLQMANLQAKALPSAVHELFLRSEEGH